MCFVQSADMLDSDDGDSDPESVGSAEEEDSDEDPDTDATYERYTDTLDAELDTAYEQYTDLRAKTDRTSDQARDPDNLYDEVESTETAVARPAAKSELIGSVPEANVSRAANLWFQQPMFDGMADADDDDESDLEDSGTAGIADPRRPQSFSDDSEDDQGSDDDDDDGADDVEEDENEEEAVATTRKSKGKAAAAKNTKASSRGGAGGGGGGVADSDFEDEPTSFGTNASPDESEDESGNESVDDDGYDSEEKATVMAMAPQMVRRKSREDLIESGYNRYAHNDDQSILPKWFLEDELKHHRPILPVTKEEAMRARDEARAINLRPIKKVAEAKARKKRKDGKKSEKVKAKAEAIAEADDVSAKAKMRAIEKLMKAEKEKKPDAVYVATSKGGQAKVVSKAAKGSGGGRAGRQVKVDKRMKSDKRGKQAADRRASNKGRAPKKFRKK